jgi:hypothetical protein
MKTSWKWIPVLALAAMTAQAWPDLPMDDPGMPPPPPPPCMKGRHEPGGMPPCGLREKGPEHMGRPEMTEERRAKFEAFRQLRHAVRAETDEAKKAELVEQLRATLGEMADEQSAMQKERLAAAEKRIAEQKARLDAQVEELRAMIEEGEAHRDEWIDEQVRLILSGERPPMHRMHPGKGGPEGRGPGQEGCPFQRCRGKRGPRNCGDGGPDGGMPPPPPPETPMDGEPIPPPEEVE